MAGPMEDIHVVELGVWVAGPAAGGILADWSADVVKIEPPTGDPARTFGLMLGLPQDGHAASPPFEMDNRSKRSVVLDLATDTGRSNALDLLADADVFLTMRPAALQRLGLGYETVAAFGGWVTTRSGWPWLPRYARRWSPVPAPATVSWWRRPCIALVDVPDVDGSIPMVATPADFHGTPWEPRWAATGLGEHTDEVLAELQLRRSPPA